MKKKDFIKDYFILLFFPLVFIITALILERPSSLIENLGRIIKSTDVLLIDYYEQGSLASGLLNSGLVSLIAIFLIYITGKEVDGLTIASVFTIAGFALIGKSIFNVIPIYVGGYIYCLYSNKELKDSIVVLIFATTLAPIVSQIAFHYGLDYKYSIPLSMLMGGFIGFIVHPLGQSMYKFHDGYNLYNIGFTGGVIGVVIAGMLRNFGVEMNTVMVLSEAYHRFLLFYLIGFFIFLIALGLYLDKYLLEKYKLLLKESGRSPNDFKKQYGQGVIFVNMGIMGIVSLAYILISKGFINGPTMAGVLTVVGFSASGKTPKNTIPILIGVYLSGSLGVIDTSSSSAIIAGLFGTTLAPVSGVYGLGAGILAGFMHIAVGSNILKGHGGIHLYNNGFAGGVVAGFLVPFLNIFKEKKEKMVKKN